MSATPDVSVIITTRNRAEHLRRTLAALAGAAAPDGVSVELLVVDNGSADGTARVVQECRPSGTPVRYVHEPRPGKSHGYTTGMAQARGAVFLFTDDDVRPPQDWIARMCRPLLGGEADAVVGGVSLAPHLERPWMTPEHRQMFASTEMLGPEDDLDLIGANMAFSRRVLERVPAFDTELGPGALGFSEETLFSWQLKQAGYRVAGALDVAVEHHFEESRLLRASMIASAQKLGRCYAYFAHHWRHEALRRPELNFVRSTLRLAYQRRRRREECAGPEGLPLWEKGLVADVQIYRQYLIERRRPRNYEKFGLVKRP